MDEHKIKKDFYANNMKFEQQPELLSPFQTYRAAKDKIAKYTSKDGVIEKNELTDERFLEVYSWKEFLKENEDDLPVLFRFAKKMEKENLLDCYILFSFFHVDIYPQYKIFMEEEENRIRMKQFINDYLIITYK